MEPKKRLVKKNGKPTWELDFGVDEQGHRRRLYFKTEDRINEEIKNYRREVKTRGEWWAWLPENERRQIEATVKAINSSGLTLPRVWEDHQRWRKENSQTTATPKPYEEVVTEWKKRKLGAGKTIRYTENTADVLMRFGAGRERQNIHEITPPELESWFQAETEQNDWSLSTKRTYMLLFSSLWSVAVAKGWCTLNIIDRLEPVTVPATDVKVYANSDTMNIMAAAMSNELTQQIIAPLAIGFFGCMRPEEIDSSRAIRAELPEDKYFGWHDIDIEHGRITVRKEIAKRGDQRVARIQPCAVEWLKLAKRLKNPLPPVNERRLVDTCCELIGLNEWIRDGLRKSCITHLRAVYKNDYDVIKDCGNSIRVMLKHYADLDVPEEISLEHWKITPAAVRSYTRTDAWQKVLRLSAARRAELSASESEKSER